MRRIREREAEEQRVIEEQKRRLIEENLPFIDEFCSNDIKKQVGVGGSGSGGIEKKVI